VRLEDKRITATGNSAATFTAVANNLHWTVSLGLLESGGGGGGSVNQMLFDQLLRAGF
jgi:hypothetical protein